MDLLTPLAALLTLAWAVAILSLVSRISARSAVTAEATERMAEALERMSRGG